jgi:septum site-determining protein MinD
MVEQTYGCEVGAVLFHSDEMMTLASGGIFCLHYPDHPLTDEFRQAAAKLMR